MWTCGLLKKKDNQSCKPIFPACLAKSVNKINVEKLGKGISKEIDKIMDIIRSSKGSIIFDQDFFCFSNPEKLMRAIMNLLILTGNPEGFIQYYQGGNDQGIWDMGAIRDYLPGYATISDKGKDSNEMLNGKVKALYLTESIPEQKLKNIEFLILQDIYPSEIMNKADVVLPACAFTESDGTVTSFERRIQNVRKAVDAQGEAKPDWRIICDIAKKMGAKGFEYKNHQAIFKEIKEKIPLVNSTGIWNLKGKKIQLLPLDPIGEIKKLSLNKKQYQYRGADLVKRVDDFRIQLEKGGA